ncbi:MAG: DUF3078 domain-containing protein [Bacteroidales bacterium]|jgi:hypothetical protein|nr:DUF3078 domain-containing protein [Bacteroidales bacterium]
MKIHILFIIVCLFPGIVLNGQTDASIKAGRKAAAEAGLGHYRKFSPHDSIRWIFGGDASLAFKATSLTNWRPGGEDQLAIASALNVYANYKKGKRTVENYGIFGYGLVINGERKAVKNDDRLHLVSKVGHQIAKKWYYAASFLARTQFTSGYKYSANDTIRISDFLAPINMFLSVGIDYRPNNNFSAVLSPLMGKATFSRSDNLVVLSNAGLVKTVKNAEGKDEQVPQNSRYELGGGLTMTLNGNIWKNKIKFNSSLDLFSNYALKPQNIDVVLWFTIKYQIYKNISADLRFDLMYDDDQKSTDDEGKQRGPKVQTKNFLGVGVFYQF